MSPKVKDILILILINLGIAFLIWLPFYLKLPNLFGLNFSQGMSAIFRNFDGMEYVIIAKSWYNPSIISGLPQDLPAEYFAAHFPGYSLLMMPLAPILGFLKSMILTSLLFTILSSIMFYLLVKDFKLSSSPLFLSIVFLILPARWLIVHSIGSAETIFIFFTISALYFFMKFEEIKKYRFIILAGIFGMFAQLTRPPGILLFLALIFYIIWKIFKDNNQNIFKKMGHAIVNYLPLLLIPVALLSVFYYYSIAYQDFWAYFHSGDNIHLGFPPFQVFNLNQFWVGSIWLEDIIYVLILGFLGGLLLFKQKLYPLAFFVLTYLGFSTLIAHRDISRYVLPIFPFVLIAFEKVLVSKEFKIVLAIVILAIYLYSQNFLIANTAPYPNPQLFN
ncbi:MAG: phospholipid carrier-dependent glycosyltransferase [Candidatus Staskawiczbacteria bacterium]|nr:phospholipid carrier-dependent glycosyltransferase [Candidatus Staskawiczbacteria bacterium]